MGIELRPDDAVRDDDELIIRAGGGSVDALVEQALRLTAEYQRFVESGEIRSPYAISVNVVRDGVATLEQLLIEEPYVKYKPYLDVKAGHLTDLPWVQIVATTPVHGRPLTLVDLTHYDVLVEASSSEELRERIAVVRGRFARHDNPYRLPRRRKEAP